MKRTSARLQKSLPRINFIFDANSSVFEDPFSVEDAPVRRAYGDTAQTLYEDTRCRFVVRKLELSGIISNAADMIVSSFGDLIVQSVTESTRERSQITASSDHNKLYAFGREQRIYTISAKLLDTDLKEPLTDSQHIDWDGKGLKAWKEFYEQACISECARLRRITEFHYNDRSFFGGLMNQTVNIDSRQPHAVDLSLTMCVMYVEGYHD